MRIKLEQTVNKQTCEKLSFAEFACFSNTLIMCSNAAKVNSALCSFKTPCAVSKLLIQACDAKKNTHMLKLT
jgi:hypothetical protein